MTGLLIFGGTILLLVFLLEPAERRVRAWRQRWGEDTSRDRDRQRVAEELRARGQETLLGPQGRRVRLEGLVRGVAHHDGRDFRGAHHE